MLTLSQVNPVQLGTLIDRLIWKELTDHQVNLYRLRCMTDRAVAMEIDRGTTHWQIHA